MLKLVNIVKDYIMKDQEPVHALKGLSLNFRRNEFVAILGPSGCGKTTLLNIIGGLDRYTSGDLIIEGKSTKDYGDKEWDTYRNHSIGFVFQSYNLIPHQTIVKNVELALTIGGIDKEERKERAYKALEKVGLKGLEKKKPNQLSGGQMQRVAIARALINEPEILLADEPTGALDSETSIQVMDLLKEVAKDCLVIMVTHNPDLADKYANRIVKMKDGLLLDDSNPYSNEEEEKDHLKEIEAPSLKSNKGNKKNSSMSFLTASSLSLSNLLSKLKRTILIAIAGSIGIIGVSSVLAVSYGVRNYIDGMQDDMLSNYPITIAEQSVDYSSLMNGLSTWGDKEIAKFDPTTEVGIDSMIKYLMDKYKDLFTEKTNDINRELLAYIDQMDKTAINSISYNYGIDPTNNIFTTWNRGYEGDEDVDISLNGLTQMYISELTTVPDFGQYSVFVNLFTNFMKQLPGDTSFILDQYDLLFDSKMATKEDELVLVVDDNQTLTDLLCAQLGYFSEKEFLSIAQLAIKENEGTATEEDYKKYKYPESFDYKQLLGKKIYYQPEIYDFDEIIVDKLSFVADLSSFAPKLKTAAFAVEYNKSGDLITGTGFGLPLVLTRKSGDKTSSTPWVGTWSSSMAYYDEKTEENVKIPYDVVVSADDPLTEENEGKAQIILHITIGGKTYDIPSPASPYTYEKEKIKSYQYEGIQENVKDKPKTKQLTITGILKRKKGVNFGSLSRGIYYTPNFTQRFIENQFNQLFVRSEEEGKEGIATYIRNGKDNLYQAHVKFKYTSFADDTKQIEPGAVEGYANTINGNLSSSVSDLISINTTSNVEKNRSALRSLAGLSAKKNNIGIYDVPTELKENLPLRISIYPKDFDNKKIVTNHLDKWNDKNVEIKVVIDGKEKIVDHREELTYTDTVEMIINVINTLINVVTIALVSFTSLSLVVSCFMIAVITYISTMERIKEIGVIRSLGGRKKDVSRLFIAECLLTGLASGLIGVGVTYFLQMIVNIIVNAMGVGVTNIAALPFLVALIMIAISVFLNVISGLIPAMKASKQDPVIALRSE